MTGFIAFLVHNYKKLSSHLDQTSQKINSSNKRIHSYDQMRKRIVNLVGNKGHKNDNSYPKLNNLQNILLMGIFDKPEKDLYNGKGREVTRKLYSS